MRARDVYGSIIFIRTTMDERGQARIIEVTTASGSKQRPIRFARAIEMFIEDITYDKVDFIPFYRALPLEDASSSSSAPSAAHGPRTLNLWMGYAHECVLGPINMSLVNPLLDHFRHIWCRGDAALFEYLLNWFAYLIQYPGNPRRTALIVCGAQGCGKTGLVEYTGKYIVGRPYFLKCGIERMMSRFNDDLSQKTLVLIDDIYSTGATQSALEARLSEIITSHSIPIKSKGFPINHMRNALHFIITSSSGVSIHIEPTERRYCVFNCAPVGIERRKEYFDASSARLAPMKQASTSSRSSRRATFRALMLSKFPAWSCNGFGQQICSAISRMTKCKKDTGAYYIYAPPCATCLPT